MKTARALGVDDMDSGEIGGSVQNGQRKAPRRVLHVLAIGVDKFGDRAGGLHLNFAAEDAHDVANALFESQKGSPGKASLYADVKVIYLAKRQSQQDSY